MSYKLKSRTMKSAVKRELVPKMRFPEYRRAPDWSGHAGDELFELINNKNPTPGLAILAITQEHGAIPRDEINYHVSVTEKSIDSYKEVCKGDFIISLRSFQGGIEYSEYHGICSPAYVILRLRLEGSDQFFKHLFKSYRFIQQLTKNLEGLRDGKMISYKQFSELFISIPEPDEQEKIAECLSSLDEVIAEHSRKLNTLKAHKKGLMQQLFPREVEALPGLRFPEFKDGPKWKVKKAGSLFNQRKKKGESGLPIYSVTIYGGMVKRSNFDRNFYDIQDAAGNKKVCTHDVVYNMMRMWQGACGVAIEDCMVSPAYVVLIPGVDVCSEFFYYLFKSADSLQLLMAHSRGLTLDRLRLYFDDFAAMKLRIPAFKEQVEIAYCLKSVDDLIITQEQKLDSLKTHKNGLMQQLFPSFSEGRG